MNINYLIVFGIVIGAITASDATTTCPPVVTTTCPPVVTTTCPPVVTTTCPPVVTTTCPPVVTTPAPIWKAGVDEHCKRCSAALKFYVGPTYNTAKTILNALLVLVPKLESLTESNSLILSSKSEAMLDTISLMNKVGDSPAGILNGFTDVLYTVAEDYEDIISSLAVYLGNGIVTVTDAITELVSALYQIIGDYQSAAVLNVDGDGDDIDYKPVLKSIQKLTNAVACLAEEKLDECKTDKNVRDSLYILTLILDHLLIIAHATNVSIAAALNISCGSISNTLTNCLNAINPLIAGLTNALSAVAKTLIEIVTLVVKAIVDLAKSLNTVLKSVFGLVVGVTKTLTNTLTNTLTGLTGGLLKIGK